MSTRGSCPAKENPAPGNALSLGGLQRTGSSMLSIVLGIILVGGLVFYVVAIIVAARWL
jgi:hypothetical protein